MKLITFSAVLLLTPFLALAQVIDPAAPISNLEALQQILSQLSSLKLAGVGIVIGVIQVLLVALRSQYVVNAIGTVNASTRLALVLGLSWIGGMAVLVDGGLTWGASFVHSTSMAAFQVFAHQIYTVYVEKKKTKKS